VLGSEARVTSSIFAVIGRPLVIALADSQDLQNYSVRTKVKLISEYYDFGILIAANAANEKCGDFYYVQFSKSGGLTYDNSAINVVRSGCQNRSFDKLDSKTFPIKRNQCLNIRVDFQGTTITAYVNDSRVISVEDAFYPQGKVGLRANETQVFVDDFEVISLDKP
jgi:hypothetical protein